MTEGSNKLRIFVVDDEQLISWTITLILRHHGYEATAFTGSLQALTAARSAPPDLIISDIDMPHLSGVDLAIQLRACSATCKVLLISERSTDIELLQIARAREHQFEFIGKPVHPTVLLSKVQEMIQAILSSRSAAEDFARERIAENLRQSVTSVKPSGAVSEPPKRSPKSVLSRASGKTA